MLPILLEGVPLEGADKLTSQVEKTPEIGDCRGRAVNLSVPGGKDLSLRPSGLGALWIQYLMG
jgi:hypothetical protein